MSKWEIIALCVGAYAAVGAGTLAYAIAKGNRTGKTFDGLTGREPEWLKGLECFGAWPVALPKTILAK